jgi:hypothetical protein
MSEPTVPTTPAPTIVIENPADQKSFWRRHGQKIVFFTLGAIATGLAANYLSDDEEEKKEEETTN